jgi:hypothetical protein
MDVLRRSARNSRMERIQNEQIKKTIAVKGKPDITDTIEKKRLQWNGHVKRMPEERIPKLIMEWIPWERSKRGRRRSTSNHENKELRIRSMEKQREIASSFRKTATAVKNTGWVDRWMDGWIDGWMDGWIDRQIDRQTDR